MRVLRREGFRIIQGGDSHHVKLAQGGIKLIESGAIVIFITVWTMCQWFAGLRPAVDSFIDPLDYHNQKKAMNKCKRYG